MSEHTPPEGTPGDEPDEAALAGQQRLSEQVVRTGMFGTQTTGDTSGYGGLQVRRAPRPSTARPYGSYFDEIAGALSSRLEADGTDFGDAVERVIVNRGELTLHVRPEYLVGVARLLRDEHAGLRRTVRTECPVHYPATAGTARRVPAALDRANRRFASRSSVPDADPHVPSLVDVYPTCDWRGGGPADFFGIVYNGHPR